MQLRKVVLDSEPVLKQWLLDFAAAIRSRDYAKGRTLFADEVVGFGTVAGRCDGLSDLEAAQWRKVWGVTSGFEFELAEAVVHRCGELATGACFWHSQGRRADGTCFPRRGRATFVFQVRDGKCLAVHSHFSMIPTA
jgi:ketosteroid isomerase-like protein